jgi:3D (Asp-Asp-Asp) domain-containing protein
MRFHRDLQKLAVRVGVQLATVAFWLPVTLLAPLHAWVDGPLAAHVEVTPLNSYSAVKPLPGLQKILVYDFEFDPNDVQVDKTQQIRPRHIIARDENPKHIGENAAKTLSTELIKELAKTGLPVEHAKADTIASDNELIVKGSFASLKQGVKTERVVVGMGTGSAAVSTRVQVFFKTAQENLLISEFETRTTVAKNVGAGVSTAAGLNPAVAATKSTVTDRKKTVDAYASKTADAAAKQIRGDMARMGWSQPE